MNNKRKFRSLTVSSKTENVGYVIKNLEGFCQEQNIEKKLIETLSYATDEAVTNIVLHAYSGRTDGIIKVTFSIDSNLFYIELIDYGKSFKPIKMTKKDQVESKNPTVGGYGLIIMNSLMDELQYDHNLKENANYLTMKKYIN